MNDALDHIAKPTSLPRQRRTAEQQLAAANLLAQRARKRIAVRERKMAALRLRLAGEWLLKHAKTDERARSLLAELKASELTPAQAEALAN